jgi:putative ABC transport system permease protein
MIRGRDFTEADVENAPQVAIVDQEFVRRYFEGRAPIGLEIAFGGDTVLRQVVGVVGNVKQGGVLGEDYPTVYLPFAQTPSSEMTIVLQGDGTGAVTNQLNAIVREVDPRVRVLEVGMFRDRLAAVIAPDSFYAAIAAAFGAMALLLSGLGIYGAIAFEVARQRREVGIRLALGASPQRIREAVIRLALRVVVPGVIAGIALSLGAAGASRRFVVELPTNTISIAIACAALVVTGLSAAMLPAFRAGRTDPVAVLRVE